MAERAVKIPNADHPIAIEKNPKRVLIKLGDLVLADTRSALTMREAKYPAVQYIPSTDVDMTKLTRTEHTTYCPFKGDCSYYSLPGGGEQTANAVWFYEAPFAAVGAIKDHLAFYPDRATIAEFE
jgi:uncharacterized protein (DUF427 family)